MCNNLALSLDDFCGVLAIRLGEFEAANDTERALMVRNSYIARLSHLAVLYYSIGEAQSSAAETTNGFCDAVLDKLGSLTRGMEFEEVTYFDLLPQVSGPLHRLTFLPRSILGRRCSKSTVRG